MNLLSKDGDKAYIIRNKKYLYHREMERERWYKLKKLKGGWIERYIEEEIEI